MNIKSIKNDIYKGIGARLSSPERALSNTRQSDKPKRTRTIRSRLVRKVQANQTSPTLARQRAEMQRTRTQNPRAHVPLPGTQSDGFGGSQVYRRTQR